MGLSCSVSNEGPKSAGAPLMVGLAARLHPSEPVKPQDVFGSFTARFRNRRRGAGTGRVEVTLIEPRRSPTPCVGPRSLWLQRRSRLSEERRCGNAARLMSQAQRGGSARQPLGGTRDHALRELQPTVGQDGAKVKTVTASSVCCSQRRYGHWSGRDPKPTSLHREARHLVCRNRSEREMPEIG